MKIECIYTAIILQVFMPFTGTNSPFLYLADVGYGETEILSFLV